MEQAALMRLLHGVEKPARYIGGEWNSIAKERAQVRFALCFPDVYEIGMSHLGSKILYHVLNSREDTACERVYAPWPDMEPEDGEEAMPEPEATEPAGAEEALRDLSALFARNGDCIGWLSIPDTAVDYPVMHTPENPQKYLRRSFYGEYSVSGVPFLDSRCSLGGDNLIIYGHNMKNGSMFAGLRGYTDSDFRAEHGQVELQTADGLTVYEVFAVVKTNNVDPWYAFTTAENEEAYGEAVRAMLAQAAYTSGTVPEYDQQLLTLSTCYGSSKSGRLLVIAAAP